MGECPNSDNGRAVVVQEDFALVVNHWRVGSGVPDVVGWISLSTEEVHRTLERQIGVSALKLAVGNVGRIRSRAERALMPDRDSRLSRSRGVVRPGLIGRREVDHPEVMSRLDVRESNRVLIRGVAAPLRLDGVI